MKKVYALVIVLSFLLIACSQNVEPTVASTEPSAAATVPSTENTKVTEPSTEPTDSGTESMEEIISSCHNPNWTPEYYDDYLDYVSDAPAGFVHYEHIRWMGDLQWIHMPNTFRDMENSQNSWSYRYYMEDEAGYGIQFVIGNPRAGVTNQDPTTTAIDPNNLRCLTEESDGTVIFFHGDTRYVYNDGKLQVIVMQRGNGQVCSVADGFGSVSLSEYSADATDTFLSDLLSLETADEAVERLLTAINAPIPET